MKSNLSIRILIFLVICFLSIPLNTVLAASDTTGNNSALALEGKNDPPNSPSSLTAVIVSPTAIQLTWNDNSKKETGFSLMVKSISSNEINYGYTIAANSVQYISNNLIPDLIYHIKISAYDTIRPSGWSNDIIIDLAKPKTPTGLNASFISDGAVKLTWIDNSNNEEGYKIERKATGGNYVQIATVLKGNTAYTDDGLLFSTTYLYRVTAYNVLGTSEYSDTATYDTPALQNSSTTPSSQQAVPTDYSTASSWAIPEIEEAIRDKLTTDKLLSKFKQKITREEFCEIAIKLYETISGKKALPVATNPFDDTDNVEILKSYNLGITKGISNTSFAPNDLIPRQEICVMIFRTLKAANPGITSDTSGADKFSDEDSIASWAIKEVRFASKYAIIKGVDGNNKIAPFEKVTREQAIILLKRAYESFK